MLIVVALLTVAGGPALAKSLTVGVSWSNFQEERWKTDEAAIKNQLKKLGAEYISADAQADSTKQIADVENLIARGCDALIILAYDADAIAPVIARAKAEGLPVVGYDRLIEDPYAFYLTFDNKEVGRMQAREVFKVKPEGNYVFIKGSSTDPNADFLHEGQLEVLKKAMDAGKIKNVGEQYTEGWKPEMAQKNMEQILTANNNKVDAVVASNDGTAGGVVAALTAQGMEGITPVSGQDGDFAALNRVARAPRPFRYGKMPVNWARPQPTSPWRWPRAKVENAIKWSGGPKGIEINAILLKPVPITRDNLDTVIKAGWVTKQVVCQGVDKAKAPAACK
jgi:D-xylose transport system substrate-binding protein